MVTKNIRIDNIVKFNYRNFKNIFERIYEYMKQHKNLDIDIELREEDDNIDKDNKIMIYEIKYSTYYLHVIFDKEIECSKRVNFSIENTEPGNKLYCIYYYDIRDGNNCKEIKKLFKLLKEIYKLYLILTDRFNEENIEKFKSFFSGIEKWVS